jgi:DNA-binding transcriptional LysR family regulator
MNVKINNLGIQAFYECARLGNMTEASKALFVSQSALSQRISQLEGELETTLFTRECKRLILTQNGEDFYHYCRNQLNLENEVLAKLKGDEKNLSGTIRLATYSSVMRSLIIQKLAPLVRKHPNVRVDLQIYEVVELENVLKQGRADFIICDFSLNKKGVLEHIIEDEEFVVIKSKKYDSNQSVFLDHGPHDNATEAFFSIQNDNKKEKYTRSFMGDVYAIIDGVEHGYGKAVMSRHLIENNKKVEIVSGYKRYFRKVTLHYDEKVYYPTLFKRVRDILTAF